MDTTNSGDPLNAAMGKVLYDLFMESGMTYAQMTKESGLSRSSLNRIFSDERALRMKDFRKAADALGVRLSMVVADAEAIVEKGTTRKAAL